ncbi:MAG: Snf7 family protein [Candidatus Bathyarchaeota archaeon]|nr:Snf7 family protein [Candidatus Bathyarchaeota archaeon]
MSSKFTRKWEEGEQKGLKAMLNPSEPLRNRVELAIKRVEAQIQYIESTLNRLTERDRYLFSKIVEAYSRHQIQKAHVLANELAELRKMANFMMNAELALERVALRLKTVTQLGNVVSTLAPATQVLQSVRVGLSGLLPNAEKEIGQIGAMLNDLIIEAGEVTGVAPNFEVVSDDAQRILDEAAIIAEQKMKERFPELPSLKSTEGAGEDSSFSE